ncbi:MAG: DUF373 family protein [Candidatus Bathyarchaeota archaeon]
MSENKKKILVLCVDRDNDIGVKTGIKTPIIGRENNLELASKLALIDPEESDANAIFGALRTYDSLSEESDSEEYEIATIAGSEFGGVKADRQLRDQLIDLLLRLNSNNIILVTDGFSDEAVLPIVQSHAQILSIRRIVVKHSERIEETWAVFSRYLTKLFEDPYYARWGLGAPGILLIALAILWYLGPQYVGIVLLTFIGSLFVIKGFSIDKKLEAWIFPSPPNLIRMFTFVTALIIIGLDVYHTYTGLLGTTDLVILSEHIPQVIGWVMYFSTDLLVVASLIFIAGIIIYFYFLRDPRIWWNVVGIVATLWMREVSLKASAILLAPIPTPIYLVQNLILIIGMGIATTLITILTTLNLSKRFTHYFNRYESEEHEEG